MSDIKKKFHEFALKSVLFKGRSDVYFCYLKAEKIAHVLALLEQKMEGERSFSLIANDAADLPKSIIQFAAGELDIALPLADIFSILSAIRLCVSKGSLHKETGSILVDEYEQLAEKLSLAAHPSPYLSTEDFTVPSLGLDSPLPLLSQAIQKPIKDTKAVKDTNNNIKDRVFLILEVVRKSKGISIKEVANQVPGYGEKTIQRELSNLIEKGLVRKQGERRWSLYYPI